MDERSQRAKPGSNTDPVRDTTSLHSGQVSFWRSAQQVVEAPTQLVGSTFRPLCLGLCSAGRSLLRLVRMDHLPLVSTLGLVTSQWQLVLAITRMFIVGESANAALRVSPPPDG